MVTSPENLQAAILLVDDTPANLLALTVVLEPLQQRIVYASSGAEALARLQQEEFAVVLLDVMMPDMDGLRTVDELRAQPRGREVPIIFMTAGETPAIEGYARGAVDMLRKPFDADAVRAKVALFVELFRAREQIRQQAVRLAAQERAARARTSALLNASLDGIIGTDPDGNIIEFNGAAEAMFGYRRDDVLGRSWSELLIPERLREVYGRDLVGSLVADPASGRIEVLALRSDGTEFPMELAIRRVAAEGLPSFLGYARDLTPREEGKRAAAALGRARDETAAILEAAGDGIYGVDAEGRTTFVNPAAARLLGYGAEELRGQIAHDAVHHTRRDGGTYPIEECPIHTGRGSTLTQRDDEVFWRKDGTSFPVEYTSTTIQDGDRRIGAVVVFRDISERQWAETARAFLARGSEAFASSLDYEATLQTVVRLAVPQIADWCAVDILSEGAPRNALRLAVGHVDPTKIALAEDLRRRYPPDPEAPSGISNVLRTGRPELYEDIPQAALERIARDAEHLRILQQLGLRSAVIVPILSRGRTLGAITFVAAESGRHYGPADLAVAEDLARRASIAIENAHLYRATQLAETRNRFLAEATEALTSSLDYAATLERIARLAVPTVADSAAVYLLAEDGEIRLVALAAPDAAREAMGRELDSLLPLRIDQENRMLPRVLRTGKAELLHDVPSSVRKAWSPTSRADELVRQLAIGSYMVVPLIVRGTVFGALALTAAASGRRLDSDDLLLAEELARRAGLAIENAQLYREAQEANHLKDEFLAMVSHELRTPLTAILGWIHLLRTGTPAQRSRAVETIERNALAQARIVDDVLDVSRVITGKLRLEIAPLNLDEVIQIAADTIRPAAEAKAIELRITLAPAPLVIAGDFARLQQVAWNLLSNAIKFTPKGGRVEVRLERVGSDACLRVHDNGQGIRADFLPHVFERFRQGDSTATRAYGGLGLGLSIVRHLVELHGGHVHVASEGEGHGTTFSVVLPLLPNEPLTPGAAPSEGRGS